MPVDTIYHVRYWDKQEQCWRFGIVFYSELQRLLNNPRYEVTYCHAKSNVYPVQYVLLDFSKKLEDLVIDIGSKKAMEAKLEELKKTQSYLDDPGRYDVMPLSIYKTVFCERFL